MDRLIATNSVNLAGADTYPGSGTPQYATDGNPGLNIPATVWPAYAWNMLQEEIRNCIVAAGLTPTGSNWTQLLQAIQTLGRIKLTSNLNLYVSTSGNYSNPGTSGSPFLTLQGAWTAIINKYDLNGFQVFVNVANGTYTAGLNASGTPVGAANATGATPVNFVGNTGSPGSCQINITNGNCFNTGDYAWISVSGFQLTATGTGNNGNALSAQSGSIIVNAGNNVFGACSNNHMVAYVTAFILIAGSYTVNGSAANHFNGSAGGVVEGESGVCTCSGTPAFSGAFAFVSQSGSFILGAMTFSGSATGARYSAILNGTINTDGSGGSFFPGNSGGSTASGGEYA